MEGQYSMSYISGTQGSVVPSSQGLRGSMSSEVAADSCGSSCPSAAIQSVQTGLVL